MARCAFSLTLFGMMSDRLVAKHSTHFTRPLPAPFTNALMPPLSSVTDTEIELSPASSCDDNGLYAVSVE